ncbi:hypothetical protein C8J56DRAFT_1075887 [Mycena floridula]|nr:hypothetical protein C8J56DRAFT_1075887 [Mycena floridula]
MVTRKCGVQKIVYTSTDANVRKALVIFRGVHNHPPWPEEKVTASAKKDLKDCITETGVFGMTANRLDNDSATRARLGLTLSDKHAAFQDKCKMGDNVRKIKKAIAPEGLGWAGLLKRFEDEQKLPSKQRYLHQVVMNGSLKVAVTMEPELGELIHSARYIVLDYTFKRTHGNTIGRVYCNSATQEAFTMIFEEYFKTVEKVIKRPVRFKAFHPEAGNLYAVLVNMEAAQVQGLGRALLKLKMNNPAISGIDTEDPDEMVQYILKLCYLHLERGTDKLVSEIGKEGVEYLLRVRGIDNKDDLDTWHSYCKYHPSKGVRDWYNHKIQYPWLLGGFNQMLSKMPDGYWAQSPSHTNLVESAHTATNKATGIGLTPVEAVEKACKYDHQAAAKLRAARESCILQNSNNTDKDRWGRSISRASHAYQRGKEHSELDVQIATLREEVCDSTQEKKEKQALLKNLIAQKQAKGGSPRHSKASGPSHSFPPIPKVAGSSKRTDKSDIENDPGHNIDYDMMPSSPLQHASVPDIGADIEMEIFQTLASVEAIPDDNSAELSLAELYKASTTDEYGRPYLPMPPQSPDLSSNAIQDSLSHSRSGRRRGPRVEVDPSLELPAGLRRTRKGKERADKDWTPTGK